MPKGKLVLRPGLKPVRIQRLELNDLLPARVRRQYFVDGKDLGRQLMADIGNHTILVLLVSDQDRLGRLLIKINDRRASQTKSACRDAYFESLSTLGPIEFPEAEKNVGVGTKICEPG